MASKMTKVAEIYVFAAHSCGMRMSDIGRLFFFFPFFRVRFSSPIRRRELK